MLVKHEFALGRLVIDGDWVREDTHIDFAVIARDTRQSCLRTC